MAATYVRGQAIRLSCQVRLASGAVPSGNPATVVVRVTDPAAATTDYTLGAGQVVLDTSQNAFGDYYYDLATAAATDAQLGWWIYAWITTGTPATAEVNTFKLVSEKTRS